MRLCILGNSHAAALKLGWARLQAENRDVEIDFFAAPKRGMLTLRREGRLLRSPDKRVKISMKLTSGGKTDIDVDAYDAFAFIFGSGVKSLMTIFARHRTMEMVKSAKPRHLISEAAARAVAIESLRASMSLTVAGLVADVRKAPFFVLSTPTPTTDIIANRWSVWNDAAHMRPLLLRMIDDAVESLQPEIAFRFVHQPEDTLDRGFTVKALANGSPRLARKERQHADNEPHHMNGEYGIRMMKALLLQIESSHLSSRAA